MSVDALRAVAAQLTSDAARAWSRLGAFALLAADGIPTVHIRRALVAFADVTGADSLQAWNDAPGRSREEVVSALEERSSRSKTLSRRTD